MGKKLVAYFSASGVTKKLAESLAEAIEANLYEIKPLVSYSKEDLDWRDKNSRSSVEMQDKSSRPAIVMDDLLISKYDVVFIGFPIWWYIAPTIINTFLESYDFSNKVIIPFATSGSSGMGETVKYLKTSIGTSTSILEGRILNGIQSKESLSAWVVSLEV